MIKSVKQAYQKYHADLEAKKKLKCDIAKRENEIKECTRKRKHENEPSSIQIEISQKKLAIEATEEQIEEANSQLREILQSKALSRIQIQRVNSRLELAIQQKKTLSREILNLQASQASKLAKKNLMDSSMFNWRVLFQLSIETCAYTTAFYLLILFDVWIGLLWDMSGVCFLGFVYS